MLYARALDLPKTGSFFLFGARNTEKNTLIRQLYGASSTLIIDLLVKKDEMRFLRDPDELYNIVMQLRTSIRHILIDEVQKILDLLDVVHRLMEVCPQFFILTSSSARKLKHGGANLLAGRAAMYY